MPTSGYLPRGFIAACRRTRTRLTRHLLLVSVQRQSVQWLAHDPSPGGGASHPGANYHLHREFRASTSRFGIGQVQDSRQTPLGLHRIARKIGAGWPVGTVFKARQPIGFTWQGLPEGTIAHRILWLEGLEPEFNRGGNVDTFRRYIYIHGLADEPTLGRPASHGCIHLAASDLMPLFDRVPTHTLVWIDRA
jgi:hypothetical protein